MAWTDNLFRWLGFGRYSSTLPTIAEGQVEELQVDQRGRLRVAIDSVATALRGVYKAAPIAVLDGATVDLLTDDRGRLRVYVDRSIDEQVRSLVAPTLDADLATPTRFIWVGGAGNINLIAVDDSSAITITGVPAGTLLRVQAKRVNTAGTTATNLLFAR
jgi:hypothetical protein